MSADPISLSIIIPVYNAAATLGRTFQSLERIAPAHRSRVEVVAINDGSTDTSAELLRSAELDRKGFASQILEQPNSGAGPARNAGLTAARGEWIFFLDADDELMIDPIPVLDAAGSLTCLGFSLEYRRAGRPVTWVKPVRLNSRNWASVLTAKNPFPSSSLFFRRSCIHAHFHPSIRCVEDWLFWMSNPSIFERMKVMPHIVSAIIHLHEGNTSSQYARMGADRTRVAKLVEEMYGDTLTRRQRNNLYIQREIGKLQQGMRIPSETFIRFPCDARLYLKLLIYAAAALTKVKATSYRS